MSSYICAHGSAVAFARLSLTQWSKNRTDSPVREQRSESKGRNLGVLAGNCINFIWNYHPANDNLPLLMCFRVILVHCLTTSDQFWCRVLSWNILWWFYHGYNNYRCLKSPNIICLSFLPCFGVKLLFHHLQNLMKMSDAFYFHSAFVMLKYSSLALCALKGLKNKTAQQIWNKPFKVPLHLFSTCFTLSSIMTVCSANGSLTSHSWLWMEILPF